MRTTSTGQDKIVAAACDGGLAVYPDDGLEEASTLLLLALAACSARGGTIGSGGGGHVMRLLGEACTTPEHED